MRRLLTLVAAFGAAIPLLADCPVGETRLDTADAPGASRSGTPDLALGAPGTVHVVWWDRVDVGDNIYYTGSADGGGSWSAPVRVNVDIAPEDAFAVQPAAAADAEGRVYAAWVDARDTIPFVLNAEDIFLNASADGGATWLPADVRVNTAPPDERRSASSPVLVARPGGVVHALWAEARMDESRGIRYSRSTDGGGTWLASDLQLDSAGPQDGETSFPRLAEAGGVVHAVWLDSRSAAAGIYYNRSTDGGTTWEPSDRRISTPDTLGQFDLGPPAIHAEGSVVLVAWSDRRSGQTDVFLNRSADGGATWLPADVRLDVGDAPGAAVSDNPSIAGEGQGAVAVVWSEGRSGTYELVANRSGDGGSSWLPQPVRVNTGGQPGDSSAFCGVVDAVPGVMAAAWREVRAGAQGIYANRSGDGGSTWATPDARVDSGMPTGASCPAPSPRLRLDSAGLAHIVWVDARDGLDDLYYAACGEIVDPNDCAPGDPDTWRSPGDPDVAEPVLRVRREGPGAAGVSLSWTDLGPAVGPAVVYDVAAGDLASLHASRGFADAACSCEDVAAAGVLFSTCADPPAGTSFWFLVRAQNSCGVGSFGAGQGFEPGPDPREDLDAPSGPCVP